MAQLVSSKVLAQPLALSALARTSRGFTLTTAPESEKPYMHL